MTTAIKGHQNLNYNNFNMNKYSPFDINLLNQLIYIIFLSFLSSKNYIGQEKNILLNRDFWRSQPSIEKIDSCINIGNDISELNEYAFDPVCWAILENNPNEIIKYLISKEGNGVNKITHDSRTYIFWAMYRDNLPLMKYLYELGAKMDLVDSHGYSLLNFGAVTGQKNTALYDFCIEKGSKVNTEKNNDGANPLLLVAPYIEDEKLINYFTSKGIDINEVDNDGNGIFNYAAKGGNQKVMNLLIKKGVKYKNLNKINGNAMIFASYGTRSSKNKLSTYKYLDSLGIEANVTTNKGVNPLHSIVYKKNNLNIIKYFIKNGVNVNQVNIKGYNVLMNSCYNNDTSVISFLLNLTDNINHKNNNGQSALTIAVSNNSNDVVKFLISKGADVNIVDNNGNNLMYYIIKNSKTSTMEQMTQKMNLLISNGLEPNALQENGKTLCHLIVEENNLELFEKIKFKNECININDRDGLTPLHYAAMRAESKEIIDYLIKIGANKSLKTPFGETPYDLAQENEILISKKINIEFLKP